MKMYNLAGQELGELIAQGPSSKGEMIFLVEGKETFYVGTSKTMFTVRSVKDHYREEMVTVQQSEGKRRVLRLTRDEPNGQTPVTQPNSTKVDG